MRHFYHASINDAVHLVVTLNNISWAAMHRKRKSIILFDLCNVFQKNHYHVHGSLTRVTFVGHDGLEIFFGQESDSFVSIMCRKNTREFIYANKIMVLSSLAHLQL